jgi:hypothetical protein
MGEAIGRHGQAADEAVCEIALAGQGETDIPPLRCQPHPNIRKRDVDVRQEKGRV